MSEPKVNILIADDRPENLLALEAVLARPEYNLIRASSGEEALKALLIHDCAVIILDVRMPGLDGFETATLIRKRERSQSVPIIFISASAMDNESIHKGYRAGAVTYLTKPFDPEALRAKVAFFVDLYRNQEKTRQLAELERTLREQERLRTLEQLQLSQERLEMALNAAQMGTWENNLKTGELVWSEQIQRLWGFKPGEWKGDPKAFLSRIHPDDRERVKQALKDAVTGTKNYEIDYRVCWPDQSIHWIFSKGRLVKDATGESQVLIGTALDVTHRKQTEQALAHREAEFRTLFELAGAGAAVVEPKTGRFIRVNRKLCEMLGYSESELLQKTFSEITHPEDREWQLEKFKSVIDESTQEWSLEKRYIRKDGSVIWVSIVAAFLNPKEPQAGYIVATILDITEKKNVESELRESERQFRLITEASPLIVFTADANGNCDFVNQRWTDYTGISSNAINNDAWLETIYFQDREKVLREWQSCVQTGRAFEVEYRLRAKDGSFRWFWVRALPLKNSEGKVVKWYGKAADIEERKRLEEAQHFIAEVGVALSASLDYDVTLRKLAELAVPHFADWCIVDLLEEGQLRRVAVAHFDPKKQKLAKEFEKLAPDSNAPGGSAKAIREGRSFYFPSEQDQPLAEGELLPMIGTQDPRQIQMIRELGITSYLCVLLEARDQRIGVLTFVLDGSDRKYSKRDLKIGQELGRIAAFAVDNARLYQTARDEIGLREEVVATVSHDLKNPLSTILLNSKLLLKRINSTDFKGTARETIERTIRAAERMNSLIHDILDLSKIESGTLLLEKKRVSVMDLFSEAVQALEPLAREKQIEIDVELEQSCCILECDPSRIQQVFSNIGGNAIKFSPPGSRITFRAKRLGLDVLFRITDEGPGISEDELPHIFERFWQSKDQSRKGSGLGLSIAKGIVEAHGGKISAESKINQGTSVFFQIPMEQQDTGSLRFDLSESKIAAKDQGIKSA